MCKRCSEKRFLWRKCIKPVWLAKAKLLWKVPDWMDVAFRGKASFRKVPSCPGCCSKPLHSNCSAD